jgi:hypothetical protein
VPGANEAMLDAAIELLRPPVPTILLALLRGAFMPFGKDMFRAGLYVGLGSLGSDAASSVLRGSFGRCEGGCIVRGPKGFEVAYSEGDGILTDRSDAEAVLTVVDGPRSLAKRSASSSPPGPLMDEEL